jgi:UPF0755 protein
MKRPGRAWRHLAAWSLLSLMAVGTALGWAAWTLAQPYRGYVGDSTVVTIPAGSNGRQILARLAAAGVLRNAFLARLLLVHELGDPPLRAGEYRFAGPLDSRQVLAILVQGQVVTYPLTVIEGLTLDETAASLAAAGWGSVDDFRQAVYDPTPILDLDGRARDLEGYLLPETYQFARGTPPRQIVAAMVQAFRRSWRASVAPLLGTAGAPQLREIVILASIVEKEARLPAERPLIAAVYWNRLAGGIGLYADPTIIYALKRLGRWDGNLRKPDLALESPYNTYRVAGLPPGPICSPGLASLIAAAAPAATDDLYFVSRNDGSHVFARTLAEHNRNVDLWQRRYWQKRWAAESRDRSPG